MGILYLSYEAAAPTTPPGSKVAVYPKTDGLLYVKDDAGNEYIASLIAATQAQQEAGSVTTAFVTPGRQQYHNSAAKAWAVETQSGGTYSNPASYNITSISKNSTGNLTIAIATDFSSANWVAVVTPSESFIVGCCANRAAGAVDVIMRTNGDVAADSGFSFVGFGDQ